MSHDSRILNRRTLQRDHPRLAQLLRAGMAVLDLGWVAVPELLPLVSQKPLVVGARLSALTTTINRQARTSR
jgi:hypothetical protein